MANAILVNSKPPKRDVDAERAARAEKVAARGEARQEAREVEGLAQDILSAAVKAAEEVSPGAWKRFNKRVTR